MNKFYLYLILIVCPVIAMSQTFVVTTPQHRNVVLEEYTGINCGYCPDGHARAQAISDLYPGRVVLMNIHQGSFASPSSGQPDFRTVFGDALAAQTGLTGYPSGTVNRHVFPELGSVTGLGRGAWYSAAIQVLPDQSPVNVGYQSVFEPVSRTLTVTVEVYYTASSPASSNFINVALLENHVIGYQSDYAATPQYHNDYDHKHMLRWLLTGQWGDEVTSTTQGSFTSRTYQYVVDNAFNADSCDLAVFVTESQQEVYTGVVGTAVDGFSDGSTATYIGTIELPAHYISSGTSSQPITFNTNVSSSLANAEQFTFTLSSDAPSDWNSSFSVDGNSFTTTGTVTLQNYSSVAVVLNVTPGNSPALATYTLEMSSVSLPTAPTKIQKFYIFSGITDLVVNGSGSWGDGNDYNFDQVFNDAITYINTNKFGLTDASIMLKAFGENALSEIENIYLNIGWRFPSLADDQATALEAFMTNGGNILISGQDIGWDIMSGDGYGTTVTQEFYTNYLHAAWTADGSSTNSQLTANTDDAIFGTVSASAIEDIYSGNIYPDQLATTAGATAIFNYNGTSLKVAGLRYEGNYKVVYIGVDLAMLTEVSVRNEIIKRSYNWFHNINSINDNENNSLINIFPNPSSGIFNVSLGENNGLLEIFDAAGSLIYSCNVENQSILPINLSSNPEGIYLLRFSNNEKSTTYKIQVVK